MKKVLLFLALACAACERKPAEPPPALPEPVIDAAARNAAEEMARGEWLVVQAASPEGEISPLNLILVNGKGEEKRLEVNVNHLRWHFWTPLRLAAPGKVWLRFEFHPDGLDETDVQDAPSDFLTPRISRGELEPNFPDPPKRRGPISGTLRSVPFF